jgi:hypothetical protein
MSINPALVYVSPGQIVYRAGIDGELQSAADTLMHVWYRTRAVVWQWTGSYAATATVTPWRWRMHTPPGISNFGLVVRGSTNSGTGTVTLARDGTTVATVTLTTSLAVLSDLTGATGTEGDHVWTLTVTPSANTATITDIWIVYADEVTP